MLQLKKERIYVGGIKGTQENSGMGLDPSVEQVKLFQAMAYPTFSMSLS